MAITLQPMEVDGADRDALTSFLVDNTWPFHVGARRTREEVLRAVDAGSFGSDTTRTYWIDDSGHGRIGLVRLDDLPDAPMLDLRLAESARGRGLGEAALREITRFVFAAFPAVHRLEGTTRQDNLAMRRTFERCGWAKECHYRQAWPTLDGRLLDSVGYAILRPDAESGTTTPVPWHDLP